MLTTLAVAAALATDAQTTSWSLDQAHTSVKFSATHMVVSEVEGSFKKFEGNIKTNGGDFTNANIEFTIDVASINTDNDMRDNHLKSDDFFNAEKYPKMKFKSVSMKKVDESTYVLLGNMTIRNITKPMELTVKYNGTITDPYKKTRAGFKVTGAINRFDYDLKWNMLIESGGAVVGKTINFAVNMELVKDVPKVN